jgi:uncharacterized coiled-coil protein SlyX|tara:strand:- start:1303 stop:1473 length:171 start_codon:yes stop_codon:yes gene_type:complete
MLTKEEIMRFQAQLAAYTSVIDQMQDKLEQITERLNENIKAAKMPVKCDSVNGKAK